MIATAIVQCKSKVGPVCVVSPKVANASTAHVHGQNACKKQLLTAEVMHFPWLQRMMQLKYVRFYLCCVTQGSQIKYKSSLRGAKIHAKAAFDINRNVLFLVTLDDAAHIVLVLFAWHYPR
jgi:hypothetical protein